MEIQVSKHIAAPIDVVFDVFSDISKVEERVAGITHVVILSDVKHGVGTRWRETRIMFGREATEEMEISDFKQNKSYDVIASSNGIDYHSRYTFTEKDGSTQVDMVFSGKPTSLIAKLMTPLGYLFKGAARKAMEADMDELKAVCERMANV
jgi:uncharacterized membrane protein